MASGFLLPNAKQVFLDGNGKPLAGGTVDFYIPSTLTRKNTWSDIGLTVLNANPVILDGSGTAIIFGNGQYRQIVKDSLGNLIWDQVTGISSTVPWSYDGGADIISTTSKVDIGTVTSTDLLTVAGPSEAIRLINTSSGNKAWQVIGSGNTLSIVETGVATRVIFQDGGAVGIGMVPTNVLDITQNQNSASLLRLANSSGGGAASAGLALNNSAGSFPQLILYGGGVANSGLIRGDGLLLTANGIGGITIGTSINQPVYIGVGGAQVAQFTSTGPTFNGISKFGPVGKLGSASGAVNSGATLDFDTTSGPNGWSGLLIVANTSVANASNRLVRTYSVFARGATATFTQMFSDSQGAGCAFTPSCPSAGVLRITNNDAGQSSVDFTFLWNNSF